MIIITFLSNILIIYGFNNAYQEGHILGSIPTLINWPPKLMKPLFFCPPCMASIYGLFGFIYVVRCGYMEWYLYPVWVIMLSGAIVLINKFSLR